MGLIASARKVARPYLDEGQSNWTLDANSLVFKTEPYGGREVMCFRTNHISCMRLLSLRVVCGWVAVWLVLWPAPHLNKFQPKNRIMLVRSRFTSLLGVHRSTIGTAVYKVPGVYGQLQCYSDAMPFRTNYQ